MAKMANNGRSLPRKAGHPKRQAFLTVYAETGLRSVPVPSRDAPVLRIAQVLEVRRHRVTVAIEEVWKIRNVSVHLLHKIRVAVINRL